MSANVSDSAGEMHLVKGDTSTEIDHYEPAVETESTSQNAKQV